MDGVNGVLPHPHQPCVPVLARPKLCGDEFEDLLVDLLLAAAGDEQPCRGSCQVGLLHGAERLECLQKRSRARWVDVC